MEKSTTSKSTTIDTLNEFLTGAGQFGSVFSESLSPLYDQITERTKIPSFICYLFMIFLIFQLEFTSLWPEHTKMWISSNSNNNFIRYFYNIANLSPYMLSFDSRDGKTGIEGETNDFLRKNDVLITFLVYLILFVIIFGALLTQVILYKKQRIFMRYSLCITRMMIELFPMILVQPIGVFAFQILRKMIVSNDKSTESIVFFVFSFVEYVAISFLCFYSLSIIGCSAYFANSPFSVFNFKPLVRICILSPVFATVTYLFGYFPSWTILPLIVLHAVFTGWFVYDVLHRPFVKMITNHIFLVFSLSTIFNDLIRFLLFFFNNKSNNNGKIGIIFISCFFVGIILSIVASILFFSFQEKKYLSKLTNLYKEEDINDNVEDNNNNDINDVGNNNNNNNNNNNFINKSRSNAGLTMMFSNEDEKINFFDSLNIERNERKAIFILDFIISHHLVTFLDFSIVKYLLQHHQTNEFIYHCIKIIVCFPTYSRNLNALFVQAIKMRDMNFTHRFLLFQIQKIKLLRQSSTSTTSGERLKDLILTSKELENTLRNFWDNNNITLHEMLFIRNELTKCRSLWEEAVSLYPNSNLYNDHFSQFLVECATDFIESVRIRHRMDLIDTGTNFNIDMCFRLFVRSFPEFLKKNVIDRKGNVLFNYFYKNNTVSGGQNGAGSSSSISKKESSDDHSRNSSMSEIEAGIEESIGKQLFSHPKIRITLQRATQFRKANYYYHFIMSIMVLMLFGLIIFVFLFQYFFSGFDNRIGYTNRMEMINLARMYIFSSVLMVQYDWGNKTNVIDIDFWENEANSYDKDYYNSQIDNKFSFFNDDSDYQTRSIKYNILGHDQYTLFLNDVSEQIKNGMNMHEFTNEIFDESTNMSISDEGIIYTGSRFNLKTVMMYIFLAETLLSGTKSDNSDHKYDSWYIDNRMWGTMIATLQVITPSFDKMRMTLIEMSVKEAEKLEKTLYIFQFAFPISYFVISSITFIVISHLYKSEVENFLAMLHRFPSEVKQVASKPIRKINVRDDDLENTSSEVPQKKISRPYILLTLVILVFVLIAVVMYFQIDNISYFNKRYKFLNSWTADSRIRKSLVMQLTFWINQALVFSNPLVSSTNFTSLESLKSLIQNDSKKLDQATKNLLTNDADYPSGSGVDSYIDSLSLTSVCEPNHTQIGFHELYRCGSVMNLLSFFMNTIEECLVARARYNGTIKEEIPSQIMHLTFSHLLPRLLEIDERWGNLAGQFKKDFLFKHIITLVFEVVLLLLFLLLSFYLEQAINSAYSLMLILLRRVCPIDIVANQEIMDYLLDREESSNNYEMSTMQGIIFNSVDSIILLGTNGVIDILNPSVSKTFGYTPEQLLGQPVEMMFKEESRIEISAQLNLMRSRQSSATIYESHVICISDDDSLIPCEVTILATFDDESGEVKSFVMILKDELELVRLQKEAETAKKQSENLLYQILPRKIVNLRVPANEISFIVPSATIMFIDIVKFSAYSFSLTPQEIMGNLSIIFAGFDEMISKYNLLIKINIIGDVYMSAGGLFDVNEPPISHADQMIKFAFDALTVLDEANIKMNTVLNVRIGVNTGGPIAAGLVRSEIPAFDIIGDAINVAARLQSTDMPGRVQISQSTYELIGNMDYTIEPRGEIYLKGKGEQPVYLISPAKQLIFSLSSNEGLLASLGAKDLQNEISKLKTS